MPASPSPRERLHRADPPLPLELMVARANSAPSSDRRHEDLLVAWESYCRIAVACQWAVCRQLGLSSNEFAAQVRRVMQPTLVSFGDLLALLRITRGLLSKSRANEALALGTATAGLSRNFTDFPGLAAFADRAASLTTQPLSPRGKTIHDLLDLVPRYRNQAQATHLPADSWFRELSLPALADGLLDLLEGAPPTGQFELVVVTRLEHTRDGHLAQLARMHGAYAQTRWVPFAETNWRLLKPGRPYLRLEPETMIELFPIAAAERRDDTWHIGWLCGRVHTPTLLYQGATRAFQVPIAPDDYRALAGVSEAAKDGLPAEILALDPYRGLLAYEEAHAPLYFGREEEVQEALSRLERSGCLVLSAASGSGKTSLMKAGIVPKLRERARRASAELVVIDVRPGHNPLEALRQSFSRARATTLEEVAKWTRQVLESLSQSNAWPDALLPLLHGLAVGGTHVALCVDQLEECVTLGVNASERSAFLDCLCGAAEHARDIGVSIVTTLRTDLVAPLLEHEAFRALMDEHTMLLGAVTRDRLVRVIEEPLRGRKTPIEAGLAQTIVGEVSEQPGSLALLSQVLSVLWDQRGAYGYQLTLRGYEAAGRVSGALNKLADDASSEVLGTEPSTQRRATLNRLLLELAATSEQGTLTRRRVAIEDLARTLDIVAIDLRALIEPFVRRRLFVLDKPDTPAARETLEVAHDKLIEAWPYWSDLAKRETEVLELRKEIERAADLWERSKRRRELWSDATSRLSRAEELVAEGRLRLAGSLEEFLTASRRAVVRRRRVERAVLALLLVVTIIATVGVWTASRASARADLAADDARRRANDVLSLSAIQELKQLEDDADRLWPAYPDKIASYDAWLARAKVLVDGRAADLDRGIAAHPSLQDHESKLAELRSRATPPTREPLGDERRTYAFDDAQDRWWHSQLETLVSDLAAFTDEKRGGLYSAGLSEKHGWGILKRAEFARTIEQRSISGPEAKARWEAAISAIAKSPRYGGLQMTPQLGLLPLGEDPESHLWEFAHLQTGDVARRGTNGRIVLDEERGLVFVLIPAGTFWMGAQHTDPRGLHYDEKASLDESPVKEVTLPTYFLSKYEMTQRQWARATGAYPSTNTPGKQDSCNNTITLNNPVETVSWGDCVSCLTHLGLMLPTEAQWEYAARGSSDTPWFSGTTPESMDGCANVADQCLLLATHDSTTTYERWSDGAASDAPVGSYRPNLFGLHDTAGNVMEWCQDHFGSYELPIRKQDGERLSTADSRRVIRGGAFDGDTSWARSAKRVGDAPDSRMANIGVRPARRLDQ
jgi:formylglycine-generating enzyme required for sulfatase activity